MLDNHLLIKYIYRNKGDTMSVTATIREDVISSGMRIYIRLGNCEFPMPDELMSETFECEQPDELDDEEFNLILKASDGSIFRGKSIDFDFGNSGKLRVNISEWYLERYNVNYAYQGYSYNDIPINRPFVVKYEVGDVVVISDERGIRTGVILGWIDNGSGTVETSAQGNNVSMSDIRPATIDDIELLSEIDKKYLVD